LSRPANRQTDRQTSSAAAAGACFPAPGAATATLTDIFIPLLPPLISAVSPWCKLLQFYRPSIRLQIPAVCIAYLEIIEVEPFQ